MPKQFDATLNSMIDADPDLWAACFARLAGIPAGPSVALDTDLATTLTADKVFRINGPRPTLLHLELQSSSRLGIPGELMRYNTLISHQHELPVESVLVLLRSKAGASDQTEPFRRFGVNQNLIVEFHYHVVRVWEHPVSFWLDAGVGLAPLALLTDEAAADLETTLTRFRNCLQIHGTDEKLTQSLLGSSFVLCGLRYEPERVVEMYRRMSMLMEDSTTYQEILKKGITQGINQGISQGINQGITQGEKNTLLRQGTKRFGVPSEAIAAVLQGITDSARLERLTERILDAVSWDDLLQDQ